MRPEGPRPATPRPAAPSALRWRVLIDKPMSGGANMARDHALAQACAPGTGTLRFYQWDRPTLSFGRNEPVTVGYRALLRRQQEMGVVRRPTGGRAVIHDRELTYAMVFPSRALGSLHQAYATINEGLVSGLRRLGVDAQSANGDAPPGPNEGPCFLAPVAGEVVVGARKLVGSAQARIGGAVLQHGSVLLAADQRPLLATTDDPPVTLEQLLGQVPPWQELVEALESGLARALGGSWGAGALSPNESSLAKELERRYSSSEWTWRR